MKENDETYYMLHTVNRLIFEIDTSEGDRICTLLDKLSDNIILPGDSVPDPMFINFTDRAGSDIRVRAAHIEALFTSSPASRAHDKMVEERDKDWSSP